MSQNVIDDTQIDFIYVHIPKCAGTYIKYKFKQMYDCMITNVEHYKEHLQNGNRRTMNFGHRRYTNEPNLVPKLICFVRHPYSRALSMFYYHKLNKKNQTFDQFIQSLYKDKNVRKFVESTDQNTHKTTLLSTPRGTDVSMSWKLQTTWLPDDSASQIYFLGKVEELEKDLKCLCEKIGCKYNPDQKVINKTSYVKNEISQSTKDMLYDIYENDFIAFGYDR